MDNWCAEQSIKIEVSAVFFIAFYTDKTARNAPKSVAWALEEKEKKNYSEETFVLFHFAVECRTPTPHVPQHLG